MPSSQFHSRTIAICQCGEPGGSGRLSGWPAAGYSAAAQEEADRTEINAAVFRRLHEPLAIEPVDIDDPSSNR
jgi:hypothetical protein